MGGGRDRPGRAQPTSGIWSLRHLPRLSGVGRVDAVELARLAGRLSVLVPPLAAGWVWQRQQLPISWGTAVDRANVAVGRLVAVVEDEVDRLYLAAVAAAQARVAVASSRPPCAAPRGGLSRHSSARRSCAAGKPVRQRHDGLGGLEAVERKELDHVELLGAEAPLEVVIDAVEQRFVRSRTYRWSGSSGG